MRSNSITQDIAAQLIEARHSGRPWKPLSYGALTIADAYAVQNRVGEALGWFAKGRPPAWKAGAPNPAALPTAAPLPNVQCSGREWSCSGHHEVAIEAEIAFRFGKTPSSAADIVASISTMCVSVEVLSTRLDGGYGAPAEWKLADHQLHADLIVGEEIPFALLDWKRQRCSVDINGLPRIEREGSHPCGDPLWALPWLAQHAMQHADGLRAGDLVTTGSWVGILKVAPGDSVLARFDGIGSVALEFVA